MTKKVFQSVLGNLTTVLKAENSYSNGGVKKIVRVKGKHIETNRLVQKAINDYAKSTNTNIVIEFCRG